MMRNVLAAIAFGAVMAGGAQAAVLSVSGGSADVLAGRFSLPANPLYAGLSEGFGDLGDPITVLDAGKGAGDGISISRRAKVTFTYLGSEASYSNRFTFDGAELFFNKAAAVGAVSGPFDAAAGLLPFSFLSRSTGEIENDGVSTPGLAFGVSEIFNGGTSVLVFFEDLADSPRDIDFDDLAVRIDVTAIPNPSALLMLATALVGVGVLTRRRQLA